jgi:hypothetical protein
LHLRMHRAGVHNLLFRSFFVHGYSPLIYRFNRFKLHSSQSQSIAKTEAEL